MIKRELNFEGDSPLLYLIATPIGNLKEFPPRATQTISGMDFIACEDTRNTGKLLHFFSLDKPLIACHEHNEEEASKKIISLLKEGKKVAYVSDAGYPVISDPGYRLASNAIKENIKVSVINGPNAAIMALVASGIDNSHFYFYGFLDSKESSRKKELESLKDFPNTIIFYEAPHRIKRTLKDLKEIFGGERKATLARELTKKHEEFIRGTIEELASIDESTLLGEMVLIIEGNKTKKVISKKDIEATLKEKLISLSSKEAIKETAKELNLPKNEVYDFYLKNIKD